MPKTKRFMICIDDDTKSRVDKLKQGAFYNKPYAELYRYLLVLGLKAAEKGQK